MARYEVTAPDGSKYEVTAPDDATEDQVMEYAKGQFKSQASAPVAEPKPRKTFLGFPIEPTPQQHAVFRDTMDRGFGSGVPKLAYDLGGKVTDVTGSPAAGYAADVATQAFPALFSSFSLGNRGSLLEKPAKYFMQSAVKPALADLESGAANRAVSTMLHEGINPTRAGMEKASSMARQLNSQVENAIAGSDAAVNVARVGSRLRGPYQEALKQVNPQADLAAVRSAWDAFRQSPLIYGKTDIPVQLAHALKKGTYKSIGGKAYGEMGSASTEAQKALARGLREEIASAVPQIVSPLKREADLMNVMDVAGRRALMEANKNPMGLAALRVGDNPLSALTFMADRWAALKAMLARGLYTSGQPQLMTPFGVAAPMAAEDLKSRGALAK